MGCDKLVQDIPGEVLHGKSLFVDRLFQGFPITLACKSGKCAGNTKTVLPHRQRVPTNIKDACMGAWYSVGSKPRKYIELFSTHKQLKRKLVAGKNADTKT